MIINLSKSKLFTVSPDTRFARAFNLSTGTWTDMWRRYTFLEYTPSELAEYLFIKTGTKVSPTSINRWIFRSQIYSISSAHLKRGRSCVSSEIFGKYEEDLMNELTKHFKNGATEDSRVII